MIAVAISTRMQTPTYYTSSVIRIAVSANGTLSYSDYVQATQLMNTYVEIATSKPILDKLKAQTDLKYLPSIKVTVIPNTELVQISAEGVSPEQITNVANSLAEILISESNELYLGGDKTSQEILEEKLAVSQTDLDLTRASYAKLIIQTPAASAEKVEITRQIFQQKLNQHSTLLGQYTQTAIREEIRSNMITVIKPAQVPSSPSKPRASLNYAIGFAVGLMGGLGLALFLEIQDTTLYESEDIETITGLTERIKIPKASTEQLNNYENDSSKFANAFQNLAIHLQPSNNEPIKKILLITSAEPNQGKSMIIHSLAVTLVDFEKKIAIIDCDIRNAKLHLSFDLSNDCGLVDVLEEKTDLKNALQESSLENLKFLSSGTAPSSHYLKLLSSHQMTKLLDDLRKEFDYVLLYTSALLESSDIRAIIPNIDSILLVARKGYVHYENQYTVKKILSSTSFCDKAVDLIIN
jgi:capsular exopolysaccharide synthesis family protein